MGTLGDRIGRRRLLLIGALAFGAASVFAAFSRSAEMLIATRALLGIAGATLAPSTLSLIRNMFGDPDQRAFAIGVWATSFALGAAIGPLAGGVLLEFFWWGSVFLLAVPVMIFLLVLGPVLLPEYRDPDAGGLDLMSAALSVAAVLAMIYALKQVAENGLGWTAALPAAMGIVAGLAFGRRQRRLADPLIDLRLFRSPAFVAALAANTLALFAMVGTELFIAQYLQLVLGLSPLIAGLWTLPSAGALVAGSMLAPVIARRMRTASAVSGGLAVSAVGFVILSQLDGTSGLAVLVIGSVVMAFGVAAAGTLSTDLIVGSAPPERAGAASGISETGTELGGALGIAVLGSIGIAVYRSEFADSLPDGLKSGAAKAAGDTLGGAVDISDGLSGPLAADLLDAARESFAHGLQSVATVSGAIVLTLAVLVFLLLRDERRSLGVTGESVSADAAK